MPQKQSIEPDDATSSKAEIARKCKAALNELSTLDRQMAPIATLSRAQWRVYGAGLASAKALMPSKIVLGRWVKENGLDTGPAKDHRVRSAAI
jgi:hypothetical protein